MKSFYFSCIFFSCFLAIHYAAENGKSGCLEKDEALSLLRTADDFLSKANVAYPTCRNQSECGGKLSLLYIKVSQKLISDLRESFPTCPKVIASPVKHRDCSEILASGRNESGVYTIWPSESCTTGKPLQVYCDMETDYGGWTMIQRRGKFPVQIDFDRDWESYKIGFGNITEEFWLGNENIRVLCHKGCEIRFDLQDGNGTKGYAVYKNFNLTRSSYTLYVSHYTGNIGDSLQYHSNFPFATKDKGKGKTAMEYPGGWWFNDNYYCYLNGKYQLGEKGWGYPVWLTWRSVVSLAGAEIKVRPK